MVLFDIILLYKDLCSITNTLVWNFTFNVFKYTFLLWIITFYGVSITRFWTSLLVLKKCRFIRLLVSGWLDLIRGWCSYQFTFSAFHYEKYFCQRNVLKVNPDVFMTYFWPVIYFDYLCGSSLIFKLIFKHSWSTLTSPKKIDQLELKSS